MPGTRVQPFGWIKHKPRAGHSYLGRIYVRAETEIARDDARIGRNRAGLPIEHKLAPPTLGQHTDEVLRALGKSEADIATLRGEGIV